MVIAGAVHVRSNHVHVVVVDDSDPGRILSDMKANASKELTRAGFDDATRKRWTRHGSTLHLFDDLAIADKVDYTLNRQGTPMAVYDGRDEPRTQRMAAPRNEPRTEGTPGVSV